jgi:hypothetical protein
MSLDTGDSCGFIVALPEMRRFQDALFLSEPNWDFNKNGWQGSVSTDDRKDWI